MGAVETLAGVATGGEGGGGEGGPGGRPPPLEVQMNLMPPRVSKVSFFSPYFGPSGWLLWKA